MSKLDKKSIQEKVEWVKKNDGVAWFNMGWLPDGRELALVIGWGEGYEKDKNLIQEKSGDTLYTTCSKLAVNIDDLQCDYGMDWYMPSDKETGDIWDSDMAVPSDYNIDVKWYEQESKAMLEAFKKGEIEV